MTATAPYPDALPSVPLLAPQVEAGQDARLLLAARLFEARKITSGQAAKMAGISRVEFITKTASLGLTAAMPSADELAGDVGE